MANVKVYSTGICPRCEKTKTMLKKWNIPYEEVMVDASRQGLVEMAKITKGARTVPQIVIKGKWVGGYDELTELHMDGDLDQLVVKV